VLDPAHEGGFGVVMSHPGDPLQRLLGPGLGPGQLLGPAFHLGLAAGEGGEPLQDLVLLAHELALVLVSGAA